MSNTKKVILFIVEGESEEPIFENVVRPLIDNEFQDAKCFVHGSDITHGKCKNQIGRIIRSIDDAIEEDKFFNLEDICHVIIVSDTDGAFIDESNIIESENAIKYYDNHIECSNVDSIKIEKKYKAENMRNLFSTNQIEVSSHQIKDDGGCDDRFYKIKLSIYYFSCNLDHILHNKRNLKGKVKKKDAELFSEQYSDNPKDFVTFLNQDELNSGESYEDTWDYIQIENHSLSRCTNLYIYLNEIVKDD